MEKNLKLKVRISESARYFSISIREFEKRCDINRGTLGNMRPDQTLNSDVLSKIVETFPQINIIWLITGKGQMILNSFETNVQDPSIQYGKSKESCDEITKYLLKRVKDLEEENSTLKKIIDSQDASDADRGLSKKTAI